MKPRNKIFTIPPFDRQLKHLAKKYPSIKKEYAGLLKSLEENPRQGISLGNNCFKIRFSIASKGKGKSGGARVITNIVISEKAVYLVSIYDKSERADISYGELIELLKFVPQ